MQCTGTDQIDAMSSNDFWLVEFEIKKEKILGKLTLKNEVTS